MIDGNLSLSQDYEAGFQPAQRVIKLTHGSALLHHGLVL